MPHLSINLSDVEDVAPGGAEKMGEARFVRDVVGAKAIGMAHYRFEPDRRLGFGHRHRRAEEMYVVLAGSGRIRIDDEIVQAARHDVIYCPPEVMREWEAGSEGLELLALGAHFADDNVGEHGWWTD